jgi:hypothetical protein
VFSWVGLATLGMVVWSIVGALWMVILCFSTFWRRASFSGIPVDIKG